MKHNLLILGMAMSSAIALSSCLSSNDTSEQTYTYPYSTCFNVVTNESDGSVYINRNSPSYSFVYRTSMSSDGSVEVTINNLQLAAGLSPIALQLPKLPFDQNHTNGLLQTSAEMISPLSQGAAAIYTFANFNCNNFPAASLYNVDFRLINSYTATTYRVRSYSTRYTYRGDVTCTADNSSALTEAGMESGIGVSINPEVMTAAIVLDGIEIAEGHVETFTIPALPFTLTPVGYTIASDPGVELQMMNTSGNAPREGWKVKDINVTANLATGANFTMTLINDELGEIRLSAPDQYYYLKVLM